MDSGGLDSKVNDTCLPLDNNTFFLNQIFRKHLILLYTILMSQEHIFQEHISSEVK